MSKRPDLPNPRDWRKYDSFFVPATRTRTTHLIIARQSLLSLLSLACLIVTTAMAPQDFAHDMPDTTSNNTQSIFIVRHGDRWDYSHPEWRATAARPGDPPLSTLGHQQARETGAYLDTLFAEEGIAAKDVVWLSSPFLRTIQTSDDMLNCFTKVNMDAVDIMPENSIWELDGHGGKLHADLPTIQERKMYFPRVNTEYESLITPALPEARADFLDRCNRAVEALNKAHSFRPGTAIVIVSHAAACLGLASAGSNATLQDIYPPGPCSIFRLTRNSDTPVWDLDHYADRDGFNGKNSHLSEIGTTTVPWNNFGDKAINKGYTGPPIPTGAKGAPVAGENEL